MLGFTLMFQYLLPQYLSSSPAGVSLSGWIHVWFGPGPTVLAMSATRLDVHFFALCVSTVGIYSGVPCFNLSRSSSSAGSQDGIFLSFIHYLFIFLKFDSPAVRELQAFGLHFVFVFQGCVLVTFG